MDNETIGAMLVRARRRVRKTQIQVAKELGIHQGYCSQIEGGVKPMTLNVLDKIKAWSVTDEERQAIAGALEARELAKVTIDEDVKTILLDAFRFVSQPRVIDAARDYSQTTQVSVEDVLLDAFIKKLKAKQKPG
jgi:transcriptional regulator with XRE-family HTH domain